MVTWVTGGLPLLSPLLRLVGVVSATSSTHILPFCPLSIIWEWRAAKMTTAVSVHFELQKCFSETYGWRHGHYVHVFSMVSPQPDRRGIGVFDFMQSQTDLSVRVATCSRGRNWKLRREVRHFLLLVVMLSRCLHTLSQMNRRLCILYYLKNSKRKTAVFFYLMLK